MATFETLHNMMKELNIGGSPLPVKLPIYFSNKPFEEFNDSNYTWETNEQMILIVRAQENKRKANMEAGVVEDDNVQIEGQPLEYPFDPNEDFEAAIRTYAPECLFKGLDYKELPMNKIAFDIEIARKLQLEINSRFRYKEFAPIYIAVDVPAHLKVQSLSEGVNATVGVIGCSTNDYKSQFSVLGPDTHPESSFPLDYYVKDNNNIPPVKRQVHAVYEKIHGEFVSEGKVYLEFLWNGGEKIFEHPPDESNAKLAIKPRGGDASPSLKKLWEEVELLQGLMEILKTYSHTDLQNSTCKDFTKASWISEFPDEFNVLLKQETKPILKKDSDFSDSLENNLGHAVNSERNNIDFIDRLWKLIADKGADLTFIYECFHSVLCEVESKNYRPQLLPGDESLFNAAIKDLTSTKVSNFRSVYSPKLALEMAIDCGLKKLFKDYTFVFKMCHLVEVPELDGFKPDGHKLEVSFTSVKKLHCVLEILCLVKERLGLSMEWLEAYARTTLKYLRKKELDWNRVFHFPARMHDLKAVMQGLLPIYWNLYIEDKNHFDLTRTYITFSRDFFLGHVSKLFSKEGTLKEGYYIYIRRATVPNYPESLPRFREKLSQEEAAKDPKESGDWRLT